MKKLKFLILLLALLLLTGCGGKSRIGICAAQEDEYAKYMKTALQEAGYEVTVTNANADQAVQLQQMKELFALEVDLLLVEPVMQSEAASIAQLGEQSNVPVLFAGYAPDAAALTWKRTAYVGLPEETAGGVQGELVSKLPGADLNGDGKIAYVVIAGPEEDMDAIARTQSCMDALQGSCLAVSYGNWERTAGEAACGKLLSAWGKDIEVVLCNSDALALGALDAIREGGRSVGQDIFLVGFGGDQQSRLLVRSGDFSGTVCPDWDNQKTIILETVKQLISGRNIQKQQYGTYIPITADNVEDYLN